MIGWERRYLNSITDCGCCNLSRSRKNVVPAEIGRYNMLIVAESPGQNEDREGTPLIGAAGDVLWDQLADYGLNRNDFCVSNVVKCQPPGNKLDKCPDSIVACKDWLDMEIKNIKPFVILSLGKHAKEFFSDSKFGVMTLNGAIEWNTNYECWIVYCLHPASTFHGLSNKAVFNNAIETFAELIDHLT
jgi:DNA polymerase